MEEILKELLGSIQPFAVWQIEHLSSVFDRYLTELRNAERVLSGFSGWRTLTQNAAYIKDCIDEAVTVKSPVAYNRAATELTWDIETLMRYLG